MNSVASEKTPQWSKWKNELYRAKQESERPASPIEDDSRAGDVDENGYWISPCGWYDHDR